jgi:hypothetical protein
VLCSKEQGGGVFQEEDGKPKVEKDVLKTVRPVQHTCRMSFEEHATTVSKILYQVLYPWANSPGRFSKRLEGFRTYRTIPVLRLGFLGRLYIFLLYLYT